MMPSRMSAANSSPSGRRATPTMANCLGSKIGLEEVKERRQQLALGEIAGGAKDDENCRGRECAQQPLGTWERSSGRTVIWMVAMARLHLQGRQPSAISFQLLARCATGNSVNF